MTTREKVQEMRLIQSTSILCLLLIAAALGWLVGDAYAPGKGVVAGFAVLLAFGLGLLWAACDVAVDDRRRR